MARRRTVRAAIRVSLLLLGLGAVACSPHLVGSAAVPDEQPDGAEAVQGPLGDTVVEGVFASAALGQEMPYLVYLPPGYDADARRYPTLYMLHGIGASNREWLGYGIDVAASCLMASGRIQPFIVVLPQGDESYWVNHAPDGPRWGDYVAVDLVAHIDATYRTLPAPASRAIGGLSMGGHGALQLAYTHPDVFGVAGAHSPTLRPQAQAPEYFADALTFPRVDPVSLAKGDDGAKRVHTWVDAGDADPWLWRIEELHEALDERGVVHDWHVWEGDHESEYWTAHVADYLTYYGEALVGDGFVPSTDKVGFPVPAACKG